MLAGKTRTWPARLRPRTLGRAPTIFPVRMSTSPRNEIGSLAINAGPRARPLTMPRPRTMRAPLIAGRRSVV